MIRSTIVESELERCVRSFESAIWEAEEANLRDFAPPEDHPQYLDALVELIRVDIEARYQRGTRIDLEQYLREFPMLANDAVRLSPICFEHCRQESMTGAAVNPADYSHLFGVDHTQWHSSARWQGSGHAQPDKETISLPFPEVGDSYLGFEIRRELGRGSFSRVYLANQASLANRSVVLKVTSETFCESQTLAKLQHANIVPIHSVHQLDRCAVICMPHFGETTLRDVIKRLRDRATLPDSGEIFCETLRRPTESTDSLDHQLADHYGKRTYVDAVLLLVLKLCQGLEHAHQRGVEHGDLKPANILIADDGEPMLLDFNLARHHSDDATHANPQSELGGTLAYMSPELLDSFRGKARSVAPENFRVATRSDIYSLGALFFELLAGRHPFPVRKGATEKDLALMAEDRSRLPNTLRKLNPEVSPAVEAIVLNCLQPNAENRYRSARHIAQDIQCQLAHLPLRNLREPSLIERSRKWRIRHSKTLGFAAVVTVAICMVTAMGGILRAKSRKLAIAKTQQNWQDFESEFQTAQIRFVETPLAPSAALETTREHLQMLLGRCESLEQNLAYLNRSQQIDYEHRRADLKFLDNLTEQLLDGRPQTQLPHLETGGETSHSLSPVRKTCQDACFQLSQRRFRESLVKWQAALQLAPRNVWIWYGQATCWEHLDAADRAAECYSACIALNPEFFGWYFNRARMHLTAGHLELALQDLHLAWERNPEHAPTAANLAICHLTRECAEPAIVWIKRAERLGYDETLVSLLMAKALRLSDAFSRAERWETLAVESTPTSCDGWVARGNLKTTDAPVDALRDFQKGLTLNRYSREAWENCAFVLSERLDRTGDALKTLDHAIELFPECAVLIASRGVLHARQGFSAEALRDADRAMRCQRSPEVLYRLACIESLLASQGSGDASTAFALLKQSLSAGFGVEFFQSDPDLLPLHDRKEFADLSHAIASLNLLPQ